MVKTLFIFGTRPEAIKLCPVILHLRSRPDRFHVQVAVTAQHRGMLDQVLSVFGVVPDFDLNLMTPGQTLYGMTARMIGALESVLISARPDLVYVQGDTTTTLCGSLAAFYARVPVGHIEAGLRTGDLQQPFPEEMNRVVTGRIASVHFAATEGARQNLLREHVPESSVYVTGNSGIDAIFYVRDRLITGELACIRWPFPAEGRRLIVVTAHRRESFGAGFENICRALRSLARRGDVDIVYPVHWNPNVVGPVRDSLSGVAGIHLIEPLDYVPFVDLMRRAHLLLTDSGGVQEEGPSLGKPVVVMREKTERPEAVDAGTVLLAGTSEAGITSAVSELLDNPSATAAMSRVHNPYGDGHASENIADSTLRYIRSQSHDFQKN